MINTKKLKFVAYIMLFGIFLSTFLILNKVYLYGDDFFYSVFAKQDFSYYVARNFEHYFLANGRVIVHLLSTFFLSLPLVVWRILNALFITFSMYLIGKIAKISPKNLTFAMLICMFVFLSIDISVSRQSIYWLTGSFNYVYPMFMLLLYWFLFPKVYNKPYLFIIAFLCSQTTEQGSMMCLGVSVLYTLKFVFVDGKKVNKHTYLAILANILAVMSIVLAPGVSNRISQTETYGTFSEMLIANVKHQAYSVFFSNSMIKIHLFVSFMLVLYAILKINRVKNYENKPFRLLLLVSLLNLVAYNLTYNKVINSSYFYILLYVLVLLLVSFYSIRYNDNFVPIFALILGGGSQLMMVVSPVYGTRIYVSLIFMLILFVVSLMKNVEISPILYIILCAFLLIGSVRVFYQNFVGYSSNAWVYEQNLDNLQNQDYNQKKLPNNSYCWAMPYDNPYYDPYYNLCFDLPQDAQICWN